MVSSRLLGLAYLVTVSGFRSVSKAAEDINVSKTAEDLSASPPSRVDLSFMTTDFSRPEHSAGFFGTFTEWFGGRSVDDSVKEEIVNGHTCAKASTNRDETYYASSFCYWMPEIQTGRRSPGLKWVGGAYPAGKELCKEISANGKCLKCSVCHNNARDADGAVDKTPFLEELPLPKGCLKEKEVERVCLDEYNEQSQEVIIEINRCAEVENRYDNAVQSFNTVTRKLKDLPVEIGVTIPREIQAAESRVSSLSGQLSSAEENVVGERRQMRGQCSDYMRGYRTPGGTIRRPSGTSWFHDLDNLNRDASRFPSSIHCSRPTRPIRPSKPRAPRQPGPRTARNPPQKPPECMRPNPGQPRPPACAHYESAYRNWRSRKSAEDRAWQSYEQHRARYPRELERYTRRLEQYHHDTRLYEAMSSHYDACRRCDGAAESLKRAADNAGRIRRRLESARRVPPQLRQRLAETENELRDWQSKYPSLHSQKESMDSEWLPQKTGCETANSDYRNGKNLYLQECAPQKYPESCEKACIEMQSMSDMGCAVIEGQNPEDKMGVGGLVNHCQPPQPSWMLRPFTYGANIESLEEQCERITDNQKPWYAQKVLKAGWLSKKGRLGGWKDRYFVLEGGDKARSAVLRYFAKDPTKSMSSEEWKDVEREDKGIILWDAKSTKAKSYKDDGSSCFKLYHFYRDYRFCVPVNVIDDSSKSVTEHRDEWMAYIDEAIAHQEFEF